MGWFTVKCMYMMFWYVELCVVSHMSAACVFHVCVVYVIQRCVDCYMILGVFTICTSWA